MSTTDRHDAMISTEGGAHAANRRRIAVLLQSVYEGLTIDEVQAILRHAQRVKREEVRYGLIHRQGGRSLTIEPLDFPR